MNKPTSQVRKAYRRAALKHHPDKAVAACRFGTALPLDGSTTDSTGAVQCLVPLVGVAVAVEARVREEANWLFNLISTVGWSACTKPRPPASHPALLNPTPLLLP